MRLTTFGEALFRYSTRLGERLHSASDLELYLGGSELNIAACFQALGGDARWVSVVADSPMGHAQMHKINATAVDTSHVRRVPGSVGWYCYEPGDAVRADTVLERSMSVLGELAQLDFDWPVILSSSESARATAGADDGASIGASSASDVNSTLHVFHTSGITAALSSTTTQNCLEAMREAQRAGALVSYDFNYRRNLWSIEESMARQQPLLEHINLLFCSQRDLELFFATDAEFAASPAENVRLWQVISAKAPSLRTLVISKRSADETRYSLRVVTRDVAHDSCELPVSRVDRIGMGDAMAAGFLFAWLKSSSLTKAAHWGAACAALKSSLKGDIAIVSRADVEAVLAQVDWANEQFRRASIIR